MNSCSILLKPHGLLINSLCVNFWCEEIMQHVNIVTRVYCRSMHSIRLSHVQSEEGVHAAAVDLHPTNDGSSVC
jgi:hypothetical protein